MGEFLNITTEIDDTEILHAYFQKEHKIMLLELKNEYEKSKVNTFIDKYESEIILMTYKKFDMIEVCCISHDKNIRALEYMDYLFGDYGMVKGDEKEANGRISFVILEVNMTNIEMTDYMDYFMYKASSYFSECEEINPISYGLKHEEEIRVMDLYMKRQIPWSFVKTEDIAPSGTKLCVRTLETSTGVDVTVGPNTYIMIGCKGEVYHIHKNKFARSYEETGEELDVFSQMMDFIPAVETVQDGKYIPIDELAHLCYPKRGNGIYAMKLTKRTKVFIPDCDDYFIGKPGDYMAIRRDDVTDIYIIQEDIFKATYEKVIEES